MANIRTSLQKDRAQATVRELHPMLLDLINIALVSKQLHWNVVGPRFRSVHLMVDELVEFCREKADTVAERMVALGQSADGRARTIADKTTVEDIQTDFVMDNNVVAMLSDRLANVTLDFRNRLQRIAEHDPVTENLAAEIIEGLEKFLWMMSAQQQTQEAKARGQAADQRPGATPPA